MSLRKLHHPDRLLVKNYNLYRLTDEPGRKTEEGFLIYKEAELQIDPEAGGEFGPELEKRRAKLT